MALTEKELMERDAKRNLGEELLQSIRDVKAGRHGSVHTITLTEAAETRSKTGLSQPQFANSTSPAATRSFRHLPIEV